MGILGGIALVDRAASDQHIGTSRHNQWGGFSRNAAINLDINRAVSNQRLYRTHLVDNRMDESLTAKAGIDGHQQNEIDQIDHMLDGGNRCGRIDHHASFFSICADALQCAVQMRACLGMNRNKVAASFGECLNKRVCGCNHQMYIQQLFRDRADCLYDQGPDGDIGHKVPIHDIDVYPVGTGFIHCANFFAQFGEIGRKNRWCYENGSQHGITFVEDICLQLLHICAQVDSPEDVKHNMKTDVMVLGGGIVGVCVALHCQKRGLSVVLVDRRGVGEETSFGNAGLIERSSVFPYMFPRDLGSLVKYALNRSPEVHYHWSYLPKALPWIARYWWNSSKAGTDRSMRANLPLIENCLTEHEVLAEEAGVSHLIRKVGWIKLYRTPSVFKAAIDEQEKTRAFGLQFDILDASQLAVLEPHLSSEIIGGIHLKDPASVTDPHALTVGYLKLFEKLGGRFVTGDAKTLVQASDGWSVETTEGLVKADQVVVSLGPWSNEIAKRFGYKVPMEIKRGYHMHYSTKGNAVLNHSVLDEEKGFVLAPVAGGIRLTTGAEFAERDAPKTPVQLEMDEPVARDLFPLDTRVDAEPWMGRRPCLPDMVPVISSAPKHAGLWFSYGHQHHGLTNAAVSGRLMADMVSGVTPFIDPGPYRIDRF